MIVRGSNYFVLSSKKYTEKTSSDPNERFIQLKTLLPNLLLVSNVSQLGYNVWKDSYKNIYSGLSLSLPKNIHLLTFEPWKADSILLRFEHIFEKNEDIQNYSKDVSFNLYDVFNSFHIISYRETTLAANQWLSHSKRFNFTAKTDDTIETSDFNSYQDENLRADPIRSHSFRITLKPMQIRTFVVQIKWRSHDKT
ncbi:lysosomal alpha-mannosidase-like [Contarinia nasturtii]|uniref:lysosomal alpha-mannosidase-like n=1 Tax=Contarinia nasturtii TaxID=265458 RepID=UPI0012D4B0F5|nr:lysosomal alpha-mannosidase-like [Contarinia nasturtii]